MGTWDTGPFDNDTAADFSVTLDEARPEDREEIVRGVLARTVAADGYLTEAQEAVAAAALIAAQCPGGQPVDPIYGPEEPMPAFAPDLRALAVRALERIAADESGIASTWGTEDDARTWRIELRALSDVLVPPLDVPLFEAP